MARIQLDTAVNVAMLITCVVLTVAVFARAEIGRAPSQYISQPFSEGNALKGLSGFSVNGRKGALVLFVRSTCHFCTESAPFYRRLSAEMDRTANLALVVGTQEAVDTTRQYLANNRVGVGEVLHYEGPSVPTPTILFVDGAGVVRKIWIGQMAADREQEVLDTVSRGRL